MIHRFFIEEKLEGREDFLLPKEIQHQLKNVLRSKSGEKIILFDGSGYDFISEFDGKGGAKIIERAFNRSEPDRKIFLFQSFLKKDKMEWVFGKGTELGIFEFVPVLSERSIKKDFEFVRGARMTGVIADINSKRHISETVKDQAIALFVGPEGGWTEEEISEAKESGFKAVNLGKTTLRAETAAIVASVFLLA